MKLTSRQIALFAMLAGECGRFRPLGAYAERLSVTARTLSSDLHVLDAFLAGSDVTLQRERGRGVRLVADDAEAIGGLLEELQASDVLSPEARREKIAERLLTHADERLSISRLADEYLVSRTSIVADLEELRRRFETYGLTLEKTSHGTRLTGAEAGIRRALVDLVDARTRAFGVLSAEGATGTQRLDESAKAMLAEVFPVEHIEFIQEILDDLEASTGAVIGDPYYINLLTHLLICIDRVSKRKYVGSDDSRLSVEMENLGAYVHATDIRNRIERRFNVRLDDAETDYIFEYLVSFGVGVGTFPTGSEEGRIARSLVGELVELASLFSGLELHVDETVRNEMLFHVRSMLNRMRYGIRITNEYLPRFAEEYPELFLLVRCACWAFAEDGRCSRIGDDEAAYLAMYCSAIIEANRRKPHVALVCQSGYGTSQFLHAKLMRRFPEIGDVEVMSLAQFERMDPSRFDYAISTVRIERPAVPTVFVSALLTERDIALVRSSEVLAGVFSGKRRKRSFSVARAMTAAEAVALIDPARPRYEAALGALCVKAGHISAEGASAVRYVAGGGAPRKTCSVLQERMRTQPCEILRWRSGPGATGSLIRI